MRKYVRRIMRAQAEKTKISARKERPYKMVHRRFNKLQEHRYGKLYDFRQPPKIKGYIGPRYYSLLW